MGAWQRRYFPAFEYKERYRLVIATPSAATKEPARRWVGEADDEHLEYIVNHIYAKYGSKNIRSFWLVGHSPGGMASNRLLNSPFFAERVASRPRMGGTGELAATGDVDSGDWGCA